LISMKQRQNSSRQDWKIETQPDGSARLTPATRRKLEPVGGWTLLFCGLSLWALCGFLLGAIHLGALRPGPDRAMVALCVVFLPLGGLLVWQGLWELFGREEWRASTDRLELRKAFLGFHRRQLYQGASLELVYSPADSWVGGGRYPSSYCESHLTFAQAAADPHTWWGLFVVTGDRRHCLHSSSRQPLTMEELRGLGDFLSAQTGWPLRVRKG
jgi:hypothetical protein